MRLAPRSAQVISYPYWALNSAISRRFIARNRRKPTSSGGDGTTSVKESQSPLSACVEARQRHFEDWKNGDVKPLRDEDHERRRDLSVPTTLYPVALSIAPISTLAGNGLREHQLMARVRRAHISLGQEAKILAGCDLSVT